MTELEPASPQRAGSGRRSKKSPWRRSRSSAARGTGAFSSSCCCSSISSRCCSSAWDGSGRRKSCPGKHTALVDLNGVISARQPASAENVMAGLQDAFKDKRTQGVILRINSPGGSPVQAGYINDEMRRLRAKYPDIPLYAVVEDICASGGYYVAAAADRIYIDKASIIGSIGVLMDGFGFTGTMEKLGIERRLLAAGENKGFLDPVLAGGRVAEAARRADARADSPAVHRRGAAGARQALEGNAGHVLRAAVGRREEHRAGARRRARQHRVRRARSDQGRGHRGFHAAREHRRAPGQEVRGRHGRRPDALRRPAGDDSSGRRSRQQEHGQPPVEHRRLLFPLGDGPRRHEFGREREVGRDAQQRVAAAVLQQRGQQRAVAVRRLDEDLRFVADARASSSFSLRARSVRSTGR